MLLTGTSLIISDEIRDLLPYIIPFGVIGLWRWSLHSVRLIFWLLYRPIRPKRNKDKTSPNQYLNKYTPSDVTIIVPTIDTDKEFELAARSWLINEPFEVIIITSEAMEESMRKSVARVIGQEKRHMFRVLSVPRANKRVQLMKGIMAATTPLVALCDDDAIWTPQFLRWMVAPFDDPKMGGTGSKQEMIPVSQHETFWEVIADFRLSMRMMEASATTCVDGGISCLSGRTAIYLRKILTDPDFGVSFVNEKWLDKYHLHSGDDKFITRWLVSHSWNMQLQNHKEANLLTTFKDNSTFLRQVLRWTRNTWRSDITSLLFERHIWWRHPYVAFNMCDKIINPIPILYSVIAISYNFARRSNPLFVFVPVFSWLMVSKFLKLLPHLIQKPRHIAYIPVMLLFQYGFPLLKLYALCTLHITDWGSRAGINENDDFKAEDFLGDEEGSILDDTQNTPYSDDTNSDETSSGQDHDDSDESSTESDDWSPKQQFRRRVTLSIGWFFVLMTVTCLGLLVWYTYDALSSRPPQ